MPDYLDYPFHVDTRGRIALTDRADHVRDMIYQVLFTRPGERVNRPDFGCGLGQLIFNPNDVALASTTQYQVRGALERWLSGAITVESVYVDPHDERLVITIEYVRLDNGIRHVDQFTTP